MKTAQRALAGLLSAALWPMTAHAQDLGGGSDFELPILRLVLGLFLCVMVAIVAVLVLKRFMHAGSIPRPGKWADLVRAPPRRIRVLETHRLSPHGDVCMFTCGGRQYLIVLSPAGATIVHEADDAVDAAP
jgi:hypothetical protein